MSVRLMRRNPDVAAAGGAPGTADPAGSAGDSGVAAFFDLDNTVLRGASIYYFARGLASHELFTSRDLARFGWEQLAFRVRGSESQDQLHAAREAALAFVAGQPVDELTELGEQTYDELVAKRIWEGTRALAQQHIEAGQPVWLVTATPVEMADIIARRLGLTGALGTTPEIENGIYTGRLVGELLHGPAKAEAIRGLAAAEGLDLQQCFAYSDSINDLPMLTQVGNPRVVNPDRDLREHAKLQGWPAFDFRTGRKATIRALGGAGALGAASGVVAVALALRRRKPRFLPLVPAG